MCLMAVFIVTMSAQTSLQAAFVSPLSVTSPLTRALSQKLACKINTFDLTRQLLGLKRSHNNAVINACALAKSSSEDVRAQQLAARLKSLKVTELRQLITKVCCVLCEA